MVSVTLEPAGITTRPEASVTSLATVPVTVAPGLSVLELISRSTVVATTVPAVERARGRGGRRLRRGLRLGLGAGLGLAATGAAGVGAGRGRGLVAQQGRRIDREPLQIAAQAVGRHARGAVAAAAGEQGERQNCQSVSRHESSCSGGARNGV